MGLIGRFILDLKIYYRVHSRYRQMFPGSKIDSPLSATIEKKIRTGTVIESGVKIADTIEEMGCYLYIGSNTVLMSCKSIGSFTSISSGVKIGLMSHPPFFVSTSPVFYRRRRGWIEKDTFDESEGKRTVIGSDVLISANAMVRNGVKIGHGAIVGAGAFVNEDVPPYAIVAGIPAKIIRYRFEPTMVEKLLASEWWNKSDAQIKKAGNFDDPEKFLEALHSM